MLAAEDDAFPLEFSAFVRFGKPTSKLSFKDEVTQQPLAGFSLDIAILDDELTVPVTLGHAPILQQLGGCAGVPCQRRLCAGDSDMVSCNPACGVPCGSDLCLF